MGIPNLIFVTGCNAAGKSSLIRSHLSLFPDYDVIMTDVFKSKSHDVFKNTIIERKNIILETPFNNESFKDLIDFAKNAGYQTSLIVLFLKSPSDSIERVAARWAYENGLLISNEDVEFNFIENFKNVSTYFLYFDESYFVYTGQKGQNQLIMKFQADRLTEYINNDFVFVQKFAEYAYRLQRLGKEDFETIIANNHYKSETVKDISSKGFNWT